MANGKAGDHPFTDMLIHGAHPFSADMEAMLRALHGTNPGLIHQIDFSDFVDWESGRNLDAGRARLQALCRKHGIDPASLTEMS
ncbi:MAG TPA: hypothetical protein VF342_03175 [Alphaproteobacteria bacterium]